MRDAAREKGVVLMEGFHYVFHPVTRRLHELLAKGELGELRHVETTMVMPPPADEDPRWSLALAGGAVMDVGCYALHAQRMVAPWAGGLPKLVSARAGERSRNPGRGRVARTRTWSSRTARPAPSGLQHGRRGGRLQLPHHRHAG